MRCSCRLEEEAASLADVPAESKSRVLYLLVSDGQEEATGQTYPNIVDEV